MQRNLIVIIIRAIILLILRICQALFTCPRTLLSLFHIQGNHGQVMKVPAQLLKGRVRSQTKVSLYLTDSLTFHLCITQCVVLGDEFSLLSFLQNSCGRRRWKSQNKHQTTGAQRGSKRSEPGTSRNFKTDIPSLSAEFAIFYKKKVPFGKDSLNSRYLSKTFLELRFTYPVWQQSVILIRPFPFGGWGLCWLTFIKESVGGQYTRGSEVRSIQDKLPRRPCLSLHEISPISSSSDSNWKLPHPGTDGPPLARKGLWSSWIRAS